MMFTVTILRAVRPHHKRVGWQAQALFDALLGEVPKRCGSVSGPFHIHDAEFGPLVGMTTDAALKLLDELVAAEWVEVRR